MNARQITLEDVQQVATAEGTTAAVALTMLQGAAAKIGDTATLEQLCKSRPRG